MRVTVDESDMKARVESVVRLLDVLPVEPEGHFVGLRKVGGIGRVFGGQVIGQAILAASKTVSDDRLVHSLHAYFMRPGSEDHEIDYQVDADMDGAAFSNRRVVARQLGKPLFNMIASFHKPENGPHHQATMPAVPAPEEQSNLADYIRGRPDLVGPALRRLLLEPSAIEFRPAGPVSVHMLDRPNPPSARCWLRIGDGPLGLDQPMQRALLAWASDTLLLATAYRPHGLQIGGVDIQGASIDHSVWFHDKVECGDWLLYVTESPWAGDARGLAAGHFFNRDGRLIASVAQEGLMRYTKRS